MGVVVSCCAIKSSGFCLFIGFKREKQISVKAYRPQKSLILFGWVCVFCFYCFGFCFYFFFVFFLFSYQNGAPSGAVIFTRLQSSKGFISYFRSGVKNKILYFFIPLLNSGRRPSAVLYRDLSVHQKFAGYPRIPPFFRFS